jgi:hypothetical protein
MVQRGRDWGWRLTAQAAVAVIAASCGGGASGAQASDAGSVEAGDASGDAVQDHAPPYPPSGSMVCDGGTPYESYDCEPITDGDADADAGCVGPPPCAVVDSDAGTIWPSGCVYHGARPYSGTSPPCFYTSGCVCTYMAVCRLYGTRGWSCLD